MRESYQVNTLFGLAVRFSPHSLARHYGNRSDDRRGGRPERKLSEDQRQGARRVARLQEQTGNDVSNKESE